MAAMAAGCGVRLLATIHAADVAELLRVRDGDGQKER